MNNLPLPLLLSFTRPLLPTMPLRNTVTLNSYLGLFALCNYFWFVHVIQWATPGEMSGDRLIEIGVP